MEKKTEREEIEVFAVDDSSGKVEIVPGKVRVMPSGKWKILTHHYAFTFYSTCHAEAFARTKTEALVRFLRRLEDRYTSFVQQAEATKDRIKTAKEFIANFRP